MKTIPQLMAEIELFAWLGLLAGLVLIAVVVHLWLRWRRLERWIVSKIRHHERFATAMNGVSPNAYQLHRAYARALDETLLVMGELERGRRVGTYEPKWATEVERRWALRSSISPNTARGNNGCLHDSAPRPRRKRSSTAYSDPTPTIGTSTT